MQDMEVYAEIARIQDELLLLKDTVWVMSSSGHCSTEMGNALCHIERCIQRQIPKLSQVGTELMKKRRDETGDIEDSNS